MPRETLANGVIKIHAGCGGTVRFVENFDNPAVGWDYECQSCETTTVHENVFHFYVDDLPEGISQTDVLEASEKALRELTWDERWDCYEDAVEGGLLDQLTDAIAGNRRGIHG